MNLKGETGRERGGGEGGGEKEKKVKERVKRINIHTTELIKDHFKGEHVHVK
jgi:hypothetical protein